MNIILCSISALQNPKESARITLLMLAQELRQQGHTVVIAAVKRKGMRDKEMLNNSIIYRYASLFSLPLVIKNIQRQENWKVDLIQGFSATPLFILPLRLAATYAPRARVILSLKSYSRRKWGMRGASLVRLADTVTVPTQVHAQKWNIKKYKILHSPIDTLKFKLLDKETLKKKYGYENKKVILYYGALWDDKGVNILLRSVPSVIEKFPKALFVFAPRYKKIQEQQNLIRQLGVENSVQWVLEEVTIEEYVNLADVVALPYKNMNGTEGNPSCMLEAMACKTPVITSDLPELREIGESCVDFVEAGKVQMLAEKIIQVLHAKNSPQIERAYQKAQAFDSKKIAAQYLGLYGN